jgi:aspartyl-tRNA(Asn)/glutamyl-tRNA(Gln) amidotransferase subunit C
MQPKKTITPADVAHIAKLANIPITPPEERKLADGFTVTLKVVDELFKVGVTNVEPTHQVTGLTDIFRDDEVDVERMFTQDQALLNAKRTYNGYFVVDQVLEEK